MNPEYGAGSCTHTNGGTNNYWVSDMFNRKHIQTVMIFNREDCCSERLRDYRVRVGNDQNPFNNPTCDGDLHSGGGTVSCDLWGRYLSITLESDNPLTLCEVKAFESPNLNRLVDFAV